MSTNCQTCQSPPVKIKSCFKNPSNHQSLYKKRPHQLLSYQPPVKHSTFINKSLSNIKTCTHTGSLMQQTNPTITVAYGWKILILLLHLIHSVTKAVTLPFLCVIYKLSQRHINLFRRIISNKNKY